MFAYAGGGSGLDILYSVVAARSSDICRARRSDLAILPTAHCRYRKRHPSAHRDPIGRSHRSHGVGSCWAGNNNNNNNKNLLLLSSLLPPSPPLPPAAPRYLHRLERGDRRKDRKKKGTARQQRQVQQDGSQTNVGQTRRPSSTAHNAHPHPLTSHHPHRDGGRDETLVQLLLVERQRQRPPSRQLSPILPPAASQRHQFDLTGNEPPEQQGLAPPAGCREDAAPAAAVCPPHREPEEQE